MSDTIYKIYGANDTWIATEPHDLWKSEPFIEKSAYDALKAENEKLKSQNKESIEILQHLIGPPPHILDYVDSGLEGLKVEKLKSRNELLEKGNDEALFNLSVEVSHLRHENLVYRTENEQLQKLARTYHQALMQIQSYGQSTDRFEGKVDFDTLVAIARKALEQP